MLAQFFVSRAFGGWLGELPSGDLQTRLPGHGCCLLHQPILTLTTPGPQRPPQKGSPEWPHQCKCLGPSIGQLLSTTSLQIHTPPQEISHMLVLLLRRLDGCQCSLFFFLIIAARPNSASHLLRNVWHLSLCLYALHQRAMNFASGPPKAPLSAWAEGSTTWKREEKATVFQPSFF